MSPVQVRSNVIVHLLFFSQIEFFKNAQKPHKNAVKTDCIYFDRFFWRRHPDLNWGIKLLQSSALPLGSGAELLNLKTKDAIRVLCLLWSGRRDSNSRRSPWQGDALPLSHSRITYYNYIHISKKCEWCLRAESNHRHGDFQSPALPTELQRQKLATRNGFEPSTSSVTG